jgi:membrane-bound serine protease (ClpP class)
MCKRVSPVLLAICVLFYALAVIRPVQAASHLDLQTNQPRVILLTADGALNPAMLEYLKRGINIAHQQQAALIIFQLNTPGGSIDLMNHMVEVMRASTIPILVYVAPRGAMAASAGTLITLAGHAAAMAPETTIGAASPVGPQGEDLSATESAKLKNDLKATVRTLADWRGAAAVSLAQQAIDNAAAASAKEALQAGLVDFIANDVNDLLNQANGFTVETISGKVTLDTLNAEVIQVNPSPIEQLLAILTDPNIVFLLLAVGVQAILIEISSPGGWVAGFIGVVCLALATYGMGILSVNWFGLIFILTAFVLFVLDIKAPTHGALTAAGVGSLIVGSLVLFNSPGTPQSQHVSVPLVIGTSIVTAGFFFTILIFAVRAHKAPIRTGMESLIGRTGVVRTDLTPRGSVHVAGELWSAEVTPEGDTAPKGTRVEVVSLHGLRLMVRKVQ